MAVLALFCLAGTCIPNIRAQVLLHATAATVHHHRQSDCTGKHVDVAAAVACGNVCMPLMRLILTVWFGLVLCCVGLCCALLGCALLRFAVLCCAVLCCAVLCCAVLCDAVLCCVVL